MWWESPPLRRLDLSKELKFLSPWDTILLFKFYLDLGGLYRLPLGCWSPVRQLLLHREKRLCVSISWAVSTTDVPSSEATVRKTLARAPLMTFLYISFYQKTVINLWVSGYWCQSKSCVSSLKNSWQVCFPFLRAQCNSLEGEDLENIIGYTCHGIVGSPPCGDMDFYPFSGIQV